MQIEVLETIEQIKGIADEWNATLSASKADTVFLASDWIVSWWEAYQPQGNIMTLVARDSSGAILGIAPLYLQQKNLWGFIPYQSLLFLGDGTHDSEYMDIFCLSGREQEVFTNMLEWLSLNERLWNLCELNIIPDQSPSLPIIKSWVKKHNYQLDTQRHECSHISLPNEWGKYIMTLKRKHRTNVRYKCNRSEKRGQSKYDAPSTQTEVNSGLDILFQLHQKHWGTVGELGSFADMRRRYFYRLLSKRFLDRGWLRLRILHLMGQPAAAQFGFVRNNIYYSLQEGFEPGLNTESPGIVLRARAIAELIQEGVSVYDFLGGVTDSKERWVTKRHYCVSIKIAKRSPRAFIAFCLPVMLKSCKDRLRGATPKHVLDWKRKLQAKSAVKRRKTETLKGNDTEGR